MHSFALLAFTPTPYPMIGLVGALLLVGLIIGALAAMVTYLRKQPLLAPPPKQPKAITQSPQAPALPNGTGAPAHTGTPASTPAAATADTSP